MPEFRWILLALGLLLIVGIWWWSGRRSAQAPGDAELREASDREPSRQDFAASETQSPLEMRDWQMDPFEPLSIKTSDFENVPIVEVPMRPDTATKHADPPIADDAATVPNADTGTVQPPILTKVVPAAVKPVAASTAEVSVPAADSTSDRIAIGAPRTPNTSEKQRIVTVRVCAPNDTHWEGSELLAALEAHGLAFGRYQVFHRRHVDGRSLFSVASLVEPGSFDLTQMPEQEFKGVTLFAVLPGPVDALLTVDEMLAAARGLAGQLAGILQDAKGTPMSVQRMAELRDDITHFQAAMTAS